MKFVSIGSSHFGYSTPIRVAISLHFKKKAMFRPNVRIICIPSKSCLTSSGVFPCTIFQYCEETMGIWDIRKYLFSWSNVAVVPALRADTTAAAGFK